MKGFFVGLRLCFGLFFLSLGLFLGFEQAKAQDAAKGKEKFQVFCASCHGSTGIGDGPAAAALNPKPKNLQNTTLSDDQLKTVIQKGGAAVGLSPLMPPWEASLNEADVANIVAYIRTLKK